MVDTAASMQSSFMVLNYILDDMKTGCESAEPYILRYSRRSCCC